MLKLEQNRMNPFAFWRKIESTEKNPCFTWSRSGRGWKKIIAFNPVDKYSYYISQGELKLETFVNKNRGKYIFGYLGYELGNELYGIQSGSIVNASVPDVMFYAYNNFIEFRSNITLLNFLDSNYKQRFENIRHRKSTKSSRGQSALFQNRIGLEKYTEQIRHIQDHIIAGDIYQANFTHQLQADTSARDRELFLYYLKQNPADFAAYLEDKNFSVLSLSPERFIKIIGNSIITEPIKGTRPRGRNPEEDILQKRLLLQSPKEQAELFMIIDLLRNDLGKVCEVGSVNVVRKKSLLKLPKVWHTYGRIEGTLRSGVSPVEALLSMFPGGSISGCPKKRAMEIINELEENRRGVYTGCIGYILPGGELEMNIAIRTIIQKGSNLALGVGGGITIDSNANEEYAETLAKAKSFQMES